MREEKLWESRTIFSRTARNKTKIDVISGQGTIGVEILEENDKIDVVFVTVGGGGLISGIAHYLKSKNPDIKVIAHPECPPDVIKASDFAGSTGGMIKYVEDNQPKKVMMVTECSMSDNIQVENPNVEFIRPCNLCPHMKRITLPKILDCLENETGEIIMDHETINKARLSVEKMVAIGR